MKICIICQKLFNLDEITMENVCFSCSNIDTDEIDNIEIIKELATNIVDKLAAAKNVKTETLKDEFVAEYMRENPEEYAKHIIKLAENDKKKNNQSN